MAPRELRVVVAVAVAVVGAVACAPLAELGGAAGGVAFAFHGIGEGLIRDGMVEAAAARNPRAHFLCRMQCHLIVRENTIFIISILKIIIFFGFFKFEIEPYNRIFHYSTKLSRSTWPYNRRIRTIMTY